MLPQASEVTTTLRLFCSVQLTALQLLQRFFTPSALRT